ncbi:hypothetical protein FFT09_22690 [Saccharomonospora piscinae]|uniref:hypothetical protein n=1 Tax=Saccharomonospora piscinae TaxID=687388 RepID=UPI0011057C50|nr:hypothetical protein [Saccharomonospora piscinae]TLW89238.1 hypothetical protein FFT09_22690 [Saccharomonospora piscinae]
MATSHWSNNVVGAFPMGQTTTVEVEVTPDEMHPAALVLASRVRGLVDALGQRYRDDGSDPLADETDGDLLWLLDHLHRVVYSLASQEDRLIQVLREKNVSLARIGGALEMSAPGVKKRVERITAAESRGMNSAAYVDHADA